MDTVVTDWMTQSPRNVPNAGEDLSCVDQWLNHGKIDLAPEFGDDDIARSVEDFTGQEFLNDSPLPFVEPEIEYARQQQLSESSQHTSSGDGPSSSSGAVCGDSSSLGMGQPGRSGAFRSFSTNDLQLLLEQQAKMPPVTGLSAPPRQYASHMGTVGAKTRARPALESVPEGAPSPGTPLPIPPVAGVPTSSIAARVDSADSWPSATSPGLGASPAASSALWSRSPSEAGAVATVHCALVSKAPALQVNVASAQATGGLESVSGALRGDNTGIVGGGLRHVPSTGTLSVLMSNTLSFQRDKGTDGSTQQQQQQQQQQAHEGTATAAATRDTAPASPPSGAVPVDYSGAGGAAVAAAAPAALEVAGMFQISPLPVSPQAFILQASQAVDMFGMAPHLYPSTTPFPPAPYPLGLVMPLSPSNMLAGPVGVGAEETAAAAGGSATATAAAPAASPSSGGTAVHNGVSGFKLRKSQSALELGAWRSSSQELGADAAEVAATGQKLIGRLTPEERMQRILRYRSKRNARNFNREIKYQCRKTLADSRPRVGGRFARNDDPNSVMPHQTKKALRMKQAAKGAGSDSKPDAAARAPFDTMQQWRHHQQRQLIGAGQQQQQRQQPRAAQPSSSSTTTSSVSSDNQAAVCGISGTVASSVASQAALATGGTGAMMSAGAIPHPNPHASGFAAACGLPFSCSVPGMPYTVPNLVLGSVDLLPASLGAAQLHHHHYALVNAAAQAAAQGVYAHLGVATGAAHAAVIQEPAFTSGAFSSTVPQPAAAAQSSQVKAESDRKAARMTEAQYPMEVPQWVDSPSIDALWTHLEPGLDAAAGEEPLAPAPCVGGTACMAVDG